MKTPIKPGLDDEIYEVESRIARRRAALPRVARDAGRSALNAFASPLGLAGAAALGFLLGGGLRRRERPAPPARRHKEEESGGLKVALSGLLMSGVVSLIKAQFGSPVEMAQFALSKLQAKKESPPSPPRNRRAAAG